jgi:hypothetical protein
MVQAPNTPTPFLTLVLFELNNKFDQHFDASRRSRTSWLMLCKRFETPGLDSSRPSAGAYPGRLSLRPTPRSILRRPRPMLVSSHLLSSGCLLFSWCVPQSCHVGVPHCHAACISLLWTPMSPLLAPNLPPREPGQPPQAPGHVLWGALTGTWSFSAIRTSAQPPEGLLSRQ